MAPQAAGQHTTVELGELFGVTRAAVYRAVDRAGHGTAERPPTVGGNAHR